MSESPFVDYYEVLQVSQSADFETVERVYRLLAKRYHPDNTASGDVDRFTEVRRAYDVLSNAEGRATYDVKYDTEKSLQWQIFEQGAAMDSHEHDRRVFHGILSLLYVARRRSPDEGRGGACTSRTCLAPPASISSFRFGIFDVADGSRSSPTVCWRSPSTGWTGSAARSWRSRTTVC